MADEDKNEFTKELILVSVPALIAVLPELLRAVHDVFSKKKKKKIKAPKAERPDISSFSTYVKSLE